MRLVAVVVLLVACGSPQPSAPSRKPDVRPAPIGLREVPRPAITVPDLGRPNEANFEEQDIRWPLAHPPHIDPHFDLTTAFGTSGEWRSLCTARRDPRGVDRDDALVYLEAWCAHETDFDATRTKLATIAGSRSYSLARAVRADLVDLLAADPRSGANALRWLESNGLADSDQLDALAASYQALSRRHDAAPISIALRSRPRHHSDPDQCRRLLRDFLVTGRNVYRELDDIKHSTCVRIRPLVPVFSGGCPLATGKWPADVCATPGCVEIENAIIMTCPRISDWKTVALVAGYQTWPTTERRARVWIEHARYTSTALEVPRAIELVAAALENAALVVDCTTELPKLVEVARELRSKVEHPTLAYLAELTPDTCTQRFSPTLGRRI